MPHLAKFVRGIGKPNEFTVGLAKFCVHLAEMVVCPGECETCPLNCQENVPVMYTRCWRCDWLAYGRLDALHVAERIHRDLHQERIRRRAYELYEQRGRGDGHDVEDWLRAEEEIKQARSRGVAA